MSACHETPPIEGKVTYDFFNTQKTKKDNERHDRNGISRLHNPSS